MRSALLCVLFTLIIHKDGKTVRGEDFRPTPIPLDEWHPTKRDDQAGTLHEIIKTESPPSVAAVPAHYWEDALRHSVYLTLVRDKIDQLIAKGDVISPNTKLDQPISKEIDDHDLWEKIKKAPFDRIQPEDPNSLGDVTIMAKGRLLESNEGFRFTEDDTSKEKCSDEKCEEGVKAFWSVKRVRQRDQETSPGKYNYELTFSVVSQIPRKQRKPYENPIRTFTVRETSPNRTTDYPHEHRKYETFQYQTARPQRAIWFHKNIVPIPPHTRRPPFRDLDRIFSSIFSDDDVTSYDHVQTKFRSNPTPPQAYQYSKIGFAGPSIDPHPLPKPIPYPYKQSPPYKYVRPPLQAPPAGPLQHHHLDYDSSPIINGNPYIPHDTRYTPTQAVKTTRPAVLPTPLPVTPSKKAQTFDLGTPMFIDGIENPENITRFSEINNSYKNPTKYKTTPPKVNYFPEHIRPPVYNAPPGVFVTMDKKPFKPMPPLKLAQNSKPHRVNKPVDFRPSPQIHDSQSPISDPLFDTAFRPITVNYAESSTTESNDSINVKKVNNKQRKTSPNSKKPTKKHQSIKSHRVTTPTPDIITAQSISNDDVDMDWASVIGAFAKTTPMILQTEKLTPIETTTSVSISPNTFSSSTNNQIITEATTESTSTTEASTTAKPKKRTRPPPKFTKQDKFKKHKRITTTSTTTEYPQKSRKLITESTFPSNTTKQIVFKTFWESKNKTNVTPSPTTTTSSVRPTTTRLVSTTTRQISTTPSTSTTTHAPITSTVAKEEYTQSTTNIPRNRNRFRQSTLFYKGTSVKHDKWAFKNNSSSQMQNYRRTSNFQGYITSTTPVSIKGTESTKASTIGVDSSTSTDKSVIRKSVEKLESNNVIPIDSGNEDNDTESSQEETQDHTEYIFEHSTQASYNSNEVIGLDGANTESSPLQFDFPKNKTKCQKKKLSTSTTVMPTEQSTPKTTTDSSTTEDIFEQLFGFNFNSETSTKKDTSKQELLEEGSSHHASYLKADDDLADFMAEFNKKQVHSEDHDIEDDYEDDEEEENEDDRDDIDDQNKDDENDDDIDDENTDDEEDEEAEVDDTEKKSSRDSRYESYDLGRPYSFLELMAME